MLKLNWATYFHLLFEQVLEANPAHVKALYRRGTSYMLLGEFNDARNDFEKVSDTILKCMSTNHCPKLRVIVLLYQMITIDKSSEPDATAALLKLKQKEQVFE